MKKLFLPLLALMALSILPSCSEKFSVAAPYKSITIIYGLLDKGDTAHYIRVEKAFLDDNKSALVMAKDPDSSFFNNINVRIQKVSMAGVAIASDTIHLSRVDLNLEGYPKDSGTFFNSPNYAYKFKGVLNPNYIYRIIVNNSASGEVDSAETPIIDNTPTSAFYIYYLDDNTNDPQFEFASTLQSQAITIPYRYIAPSNFSFTNYNGTVSTVPAGVAQTFIRFNWVDSNTSTGQTVRRYSDFDLGFDELTPSNNQTYYNYSVKNTAMYNALKSGMGAAPVNIVRLMDRCELISYLGAPDFYNYIKISALQGTGLTGSEIQPSFTNIKGKNVLGLFSSRVMRKGAVTITPQTIYALETLDLVSSLRIVGTVY